MVNLAAGPHLQPMCQIRCKYMQKWPTYGQKCDFQYGGRRHFGFCGISILLVKPAREPHFLSLCKIWCKNPLKNGQVMAIYLNLKMAAAAMLNLLPVSIFVICSSLDGGWGVGMFL